VPFRPRVESSTLPELDGLRGLAVLLTVIYHLALYIPRVVTLQPGGWLGPGLGATAGLLAFGATGVHLFFVLSGFLLVRPYAAAVLERRARPSTGRFLLRRAIRIFPAYWVALLLIVVLFRRDYLAAERLPDLLLHVLMLHNWSDATIETINPPFWTMPIESQFYLALPLLALLLHAGLRAGRRAGLVLLIGVVALSPALYLLIAGGLSLLSEQASHHRTALYALGFLFTFGAGAAAGFLHVAHALGRLPHALQGRLPRLCGAAGFVGLLLLAAQAVGNAFFPGTMNERRWIYWAWSVPLLSLGYTGLLLGTVLGFPAWKRWFSSSALCFVGKISYSLYIWNIPLLYYGVLPLARATGSDLWTVVIGLASIVLVLIPVSYLSFALVERPAFQLRFRLR
jgi:peptidoglycan/LPS O-acetylase OafA/YrhL